MHGLSFLETASLVVSAAAGKTGVAMEPIPNTVARPYEKSRKKSRISENDRLSCRIQFIGFGLLLLVLNATLPGLFRIE
jgi:hypothetical protein